MGRKSKRRKRKNRQKTSFAKIIVPFIIVINIVFTIAVLSIFAHVGSEPTALIASWFAFTTGELFALANIKNTKIKNENQTNVQEEAYNEDEGGIS